MSIQERDYMKDQAPALPPAPTKSDSLAVVMHLLGFCGFLIPAGGNIIGPLVLWLIKRPESAALDRIGKEVLNFQIAFSIYFIVASLLIFVLVGFILLPVLFVTWIVLIIRASMKASAGEEYRYPFIFRCLT